MSDDECVMPAGSAAGEGLSMYCKDVGACPASYGNAVVVAVVVAEVVLAVAFVVAAGISSKSKKQYK